MPSLHDSFTAVNEQLRRSCFAQRDLGHIELPGIQTVTAPDNTEVPYVTFGDVHESPIVMVTSTPYATQLKDAHYLLRLAATRIGLGGTIPIIGMQLYHPADQPFSKGQKRLVSQGDFSPLATRQLPVLESLGLHDGQHLILHGHSMTADVNTETAFGNSFNEHRGVLPLAGLGVVELARTKKRILGAAGMFMAFSRSGGDLAQNVLDAGIPALSEAWNIPRGAKPQQVKKVINKQVNKDVIRYVRQSLSSNWALAEGFATTRSLEQLRVLLSKVAYPVTVVRSTDSRVFDKKAFAALKQFHPHDVFEVAGDHSRDDNIRKAAQLAHFTVNRSLDRAA
jgi:hypothetical protein